MKKPYTWIEIDKDAFEHNVSQYKKILGKKLLACVVKSNAYGHGLREVAQLCQESKHVDWLCTATLSDAVTLQKYGITKPKLVLSCIDIDPIHAINTTITFMVGDYQTAEKLNAIGKKNNWLFNIHLNIDTGLSRLGFYPQEIINAVYEIKKLPFVCIEGIYSHFAESQKEDDSYSQLQQNKFIAVLKQLKTNNIEIPLKHLANSAATTCFDLPECNLFRVGAGVYGIWSSEVTKKITQAKYPHFSLKPVLTWKTTITNIKTIPSHQFVGYDRTYKTTHQTKIAIAPVGYYDGYDFRLSNTGYANINNHIVPIVGRVSMNLTMFDITDLPNVSIDDEIILLGNYQHVTPYDLALYTNNPNVREMITTISSSISRIIVQKNKELSILAQHANKNLET